MAKQNWLFRILFLFGTSVNLYIAIDTFGSIGWLVSLIALSFFFGYFERQIEIHGQVYPLSGENMDYSLLEDNRATPTISEPSFRKEDDEEEEEEEEETEKTPSFAE